uniref:Exodeoxyribonuclease n=1 Tax=Escherichia virus LS3 TaxID=2743777 RepID=A0A7D5FNJ9_9CAUD
MQESRELKTGKNKGQIKTEWKKYPKREDMTLWDCMVTLAAKAGMTEEELLVQAQVARICRASDYDPKSKEVILWTPSMTSNKKIALVLDGDYLVFSSMAAAEDETDWGDDIWTLICDHAKARRILENTIAEIVKKRKAWKDAKIVMCFTDDYNWRKDVLPTYKANRKGSRKPVGYKKFVAEVMADQRFNSFLRPTLEGDDCMGIIGTRPQIVGCDHAVLVSCDKDFKTIPNCEFFWLTTGEILSHTTAEADYWHMEQTIKGDTTDGYGGIPGWWGHHSCVP